MTYIRYLALRNNNSWLIFILHAGIRERVTPWICLLVEKRIVAHRAKKCATLCSTQMFVTTTIRTGHWSLFLATCLLFTVSQIFSSIKRFLAEVLFVYHLYHACYMSRSSRSVLGQPNDVRFSAQTVELLPTSFFSSSCRFLSHSFESSSSSCSQRLRISVILSVQEFRLHLRIKRAKLFLIYAVTGQKKLEDKV